MITLNLLAILDRSTCWSDIYNQLLKYNMPDKNLVRGKAFEKFCKYYYLVEPTVKREYKNVWLFSEIPYYIRKKLNLSNIDHGIDLILESHNNTISAIQCKFIQNQDRKVSWTNDGIANLLAEGDEADYLVVFTNASGLDKHTLSKKQNRLKLVCLGDLLSISSSTIQGIKNNIAGSTTILTNTNKPRADQEKAIKEVLLGFKHNDRGQLILPCGAGKSLVALWIKESLNVKHTLMLVPSLALLRQIKNEWAANSNRYIPYICVCSEKDIDKEKKRDSAVVHTYEINGNVSTDPEEIHGFLNKNKETIVYSTYQSLEALCQAAKYSKFKFDLAICDEAHKTSGSKLSKFGLIHSDENIPVKKRLYMTATPRILSNSAVNKLNNEEINYLHDMSNPNIFGTEFYRMSFKEAIDQNILVDYQIVAIGVSDQEIQQAIEQRKYISDDETIDEIANNYALEKFMQKNGPTHAITFHSSVKKAKAFQERHRKICYNIDVFHVNGNQTANERNKIIDAFKSSQKTVMTNARCLTEGINITTIDVVYFCDPKNSKIDVIQAAGRALRKPDPPKQKKLGYIVVPIFHRNAESLEEIISTGPFKNLVSIIRALCSHDERLIVEIKKFQREIGESKIRDHHISIDELSKIITIDGFHEKLQESLFQQIINKTSTFISLAEKCPELLKEWNFSKNILDTNKVSFGSKQKASWKCIKGHEYEAIIHVRSSGHGCSYCARKKVALENSLSYKDSLLAEELHPTKNTFTASEISYSSNKQAWWQCKNGHEFEAAIGNRYRGTRCPYCAGKKAHHDYNLVTICPSLAKEWHPELNGSLSPSDVTPGQKIKVWWICAVGHVWNAILLNRFNGGGCPDCDGRKLSLTHNLAVKYSDLAQEFHPKKNGLSTPHDFTPGSGAIVWWLCKGGHEWNASIGSRVNGNNCPYCAGKRAHSNYNLAVLFPDLAKQWHPELNGTLTPHEVTPGKKTKIFWICDKGHVWQAAIYSRSKGHGCMRCRKK